MCSLHLKNNLQPNPWTSLNCWVEIKETMWWRKPSGLISRSLKTPLALKPSFLQGSYVYGHTSCLSLTFKEQP